MGIFSLVLHTHLPYVRRNGVWPCGEDFFHQAASECYLPILRTLERLAGRGLRDFATVGMTPLIAHQLQDPYMLRELELYLGRYEPRALRQVANYAGRHAREVRDLAAFYALFAREQLAGLGRAQRGIARAYGDLERAGAIEIIGGPASHPYLPRIEEPAVLRAQIEVGAAEHERVFGSRPRGMWLPECAYAPSRGIEEALLGAGIRYTLVDGPTLVRAAGHGSTASPWRVGGSDLLAVGRNLEMTGRVWSPTGGYPTRPWYRDFHHYDMEAGFKNWRVTSRHAPLPEKKPYEPVRAAAHARADADRFVAALERAFDARARVAGDPGIIVVCYDTELFGHWWFEGPVWLDALLERLAEHPRIRPLTVSRAIETVRPAGAAPLEAGSWGEGKDDRSWFAPETADLWRALAEAEAETVRLADKLAGEPAIDQLVRELLLLQSSDWPFMILRGRNPAYARERFDGHQARWSELAGLLLRRAPRDVQARRAAELFEIDNPFPTLKAGVLAAPEPGGRGPGPAERIRRPPTG